MFSGLKKKKEGKNKKVKVSKFVFYRRKDIRTKII